MRKRNSVLRVSKVPMAASTEAFGFLSRVASKNPHIWPRSMEEIRAYCDDGCLFGAWLDSEMVALCYAAEDGSEFEIGGLAVDAAIRDIGLGTFLVRMALVQTIAYERPWKNGYTIIAHVHRDNQDPRNLLARLGFVFVRTVHVPAANAPTSMARNADGTITGDLFHFSVEGLRELERWLTKEFNGTLGRDTRKVEVTLGAPATLELLREALTQELTDARASEETPQGGTPNRPLPR